ncbi:hypothetical protein QEN19_003238 [Hanseniaspora menglaensis]
MIEEDNIGHSNDINLINRIVHGHIHNYNDMTLVHGHLHNEHNNNSDFNHFEFINLNSNGQSNLVAGKDVLTGNFHDEILNNSVAIGKTQSETDFDMLLDDCKCNPQIIEICCENDKHDEDNHHHSVGSSESKETAIESNNYDLISVSNKSTNISLEEIQKDLLFLDDCNLENKEVSKDVIMNFLDITKMYDIPILNNAHGKIVHQENLLKTGLPNGSDSGVASNQKIIEKIPSTSAHHHHKLEIHSHGRHAHNNSNALKDKSHLLSCDYEFECQSVEQPKPNNPVGNENFLQFNWNEKIVNTNSSELIKCKWDSCKQAFNNTMDLQSHLIIDHLGNGDCKHSSKKHAGLDDIHTHFINHTNENDIQPENNSIKKEFEEECFWDSCHFETSDICGLLDHINSTHGINFNMSVNGDPITKNESGFENSNLKQISVKSDHTHRHNIIKLTEANAAHICLWKGCGKHFSSARELDGHLQEHLPKRLPNYECQWDDCSKHFKQRQKLERHLKSHSCYKGFQCPSCSKYFSTSDILLQHKRKVHCCCEEHGTDTACAEISSVSGLS